MDEKKGAGHFTVALQRCEVRMAWTFVQMLLTFWPRACILAVGVGASPSVKVQGYLSLHRPTLLYK
jgi:hypothetical protein